MILIGFYCFERLIRMISYQGVALLSARWLTDKRKLGKKKIEQNFQDFSSSFTWNGF